MVNTIDISYSSSYASGFVNDKASVVRFVALLNAGYRLFHSYDEKAVKNSVSALSYKGRSQCYEWLCKLKYQNQYTGDLLTRKELRRFLTFQYIFIDVQAMPYRNLSSMLANISMKPNIIGKANNHAYRLFYLLDRPFPLTCYTETYYQFVEAFMQPGWYLSNVSTPKVIKGHRSVLIHEALLVSYGSYALY